MVFRATEFLLLIVITLIRLIKKTLYLILSLLIEIKLKENKNVYEMNNKV